jgi:hypothetical protein
MDLEAGFRDGCGCSDNLSAFIFIGEWNDARRGDSVSWEVGEIAGKEEFSGEVLFRRFFGQNVFEV